eukprot:550390_1
MSLQVPLPLTHANQVSQWSSFEVFIWIRKHNDKFGLSQDDLDNIEESPLTGKQLVSKDDEQLCKYWLISIHAARKILKSIINQKIFEKKEEKKNKIFTLSDVLSASRQTPNIQPNWTGGAPRTVVVRNKIPPIKEHIGYLHCIEGVKYQQQMEWKKAIEKFKLGIALLEVTLVD